MAFRSQITATSAPYAFPNDKRKEEEPPKPENPEQPLLDQNAQLLADIASAAAQNEAKGITIADQEALLTTHTVDQ